jgi:sRNA-binding regulator protein Hfq
MELTPERERTRGTSEREERIGPREVELIRYRDNRTPLQFRLVNGETIEGSIRWYDHTALRIVQPDRTELTLLLHAIIYYKTRS